MAYYVKANPKVAEILGKTDCRHRLPDGNYLLWQADLLPIAPSYMLKQAVAAVGGVLLTQEAAHEEYLGRESAALPEPENPEYAMPKPENPEYAMPKPEGEETAEPQTEPQEEAEE